MPGAFDVPNVHFETVVSLTNKMATGGYRGVGWPAMCYTREMVLSKAAKLLGIDLADLYFKNFIRKDQFSYTSATNQTYDSGDYHRVLGKCLDLSGYRNLKQQARRTADGTLRGITIRRQPTRMARMPSSSSSIRSSAPATSNASSRSKTAAI